MWAAGFWAWSTTDGAATLAFTWEDPVSGGCNLTCSPVLTQGQVNRSSCASLSVLLGAATAWRLRKFFQSACGGSPMELEDWQPTSKIEGESLRSWCDSSFSCEISIEDDVPALWSEEKKQWHRYWFVEKCSFHKFENIAVSTYKHTDTHTHAQLR